MFSLASHEAKVAKRFARSDSKNRCAFQIRCDRRDKPLLSLKETGSFGLFRLRNRVWSTMLRFSFKVAALQRTVIDYSLAAHI